MWGGGGLFVQVCTKCGRGKGMMCTIVGGTGLGFAFHGGWSLFTSEFVGGERSIVPLGHRTIC